ncbi:hypothetical protein ACFU96_39960 [Streptomyces sp. NPDC057620]|uniref:hypothetical protein n=1 Tax=Streptomyces sp. NPDC057620 TaxID=3346185 RepID=UPI0036C1C0A4
MTTDQTLVPLPSARSLPVVFGAGAAIGVLGGTIGLGGAEFRLSLLISLFGFAALSAVILNKAMSLMVVLAALPARLAAVSAPEPYPLMRKPYCCAPVTVRGPSRPIFLRHTSKLGERWMVDRGGAGDGSACSRTAERDDVDRQLERLVDPAHVVSTVMKMPSPWACGFHPWPGAVAPTPAITIGITPPCSTHARNTKCASPSRHPAIRIVTSKR